MKRKKYGKNEERVSILSTLLGTVFEPKQQQFLYFIKKTGKLADL